MRTMAAGRMGRSRDRELEVVRERPCAGGRLTFRMLGSPWKRLRGLLGTGPDAAPVALVGCSQIHSFGMRYRLDVAFVSRAGVVLEVHRSVPPGRLLGNRRAWVTLERPHARGDWLAPGEVVSLMVAG